MPVEKNKSESYGFRTGINTLDQVLGGYIKCASGQGILGAIFGAAGTGKSTLALQLCCRFLVDKHIRSNDKNTMPYAAIYITHDKTNIVKEKVGDFQHFQLEDDSKQASEAFTIVPDSLDNLLEDNDNRYQLHVIQIPFEEEHQIAILQNVFDTLTQRLEVLEDKNKDGYGNVVICIDNIQTIHPSALISAISGKGAGAYSGEKKDTSELGKTKRSFYMELHKYCGERGIHTFLVIEEDIPEGIDPEKSDISSRPEVYAADIVIRMGIHVYDQGYRERFIQVMKAKNQFYYRGKHHCSIVSKNGGGRPGEKNRGVLIYPSIPMQLSVVGRENGDESGPARGKIDLGIKSLDEKIKDKIGLNEQDEQGYITLGTNCVLVSDLDIMATEIALHFAMNNVGYGLYISFMHKQKSVNNIAERFWEPEVIKQRITIKDFAPEYISEHKLLRDIDRLICNTQREKAKDRPLLIVIDNVFELRCKYPLIKDARTFLAALLELFSKRKVTALVVDTVEVGEGKNPIESSVAAGLADNVFLLRHVEFHLRPHRVFSAVKLVGAHTPDNLWDLIEIKDKIQGKVNLEAQDTFALYKNVLIGQPEPVTITLSLYIDAEGSPFHEYLKGQITSLEQMFGESLNVNLYGAQEYSRVHSFLTSTERLPRGDCHIVALDEFWLKELIAKGLLEEITDHVKDKDRRNKYVCAAHDIAIYKDFENQEQKKGIDKLSSKEQFDELAKRHKKWYAVPARNNCGILCLNANLVREVFYKYTNEKIKKWLNDLSDSKKHESKKSESKKTISWDDLLEFRRALPDAWQQYVNKYEVTTFFTFSMDQIESCVCFLLELALSYDKKRLFLLPHKDKLSFRMCIEELPIKALQIFISLLDEEHLRQVARGRFRASKDEPAALFSRRWMSTLGCLRLRKRKRKKANSLDIETVPDCNGYFETIEPYPLPVGLNGEPRPVSGTWYAGILKGSTAIETGVKVIQQFTQVRDELYKLNNYIGFPVTENFYNTEAYRLPYSDRFKELAKVQSDFMSEPPTINNREYKEHVLKGYPLYRILIEDYPHLTPILWRLMIKTAKLALTKSQSIRLAGLSEEDLRRLKDEAADEYRALSEINS